MDRFIITCLRDVLDACNRVEEYFDGAPRRFDKFVNNDLLRSGVERWFVQTAICTTHPLVQL